VQQPFESGPALPVAISISEPPVAPVAVSFVSEPRTAAREDVRPERGGVQRASWMRRTAGWGVDLALLGILFAPHLVVAARLAGDRRPAWSVLLAEPALWLGFGAGLALAWSWIFVALWARTPGMALTGQRLRLSSGGAPTPVGAFARALLAVLSGGLALFGFAFALFDDRGQTLHDKICGCIAVVD